MLVYDALWQQSIIGQEASGMNALLIVPMSRLNGIRGQQDGCFRWTIYVVRKNSILHLYQSINVSYSINIAYSILATSSGVCTEKQKYSCFKNISGVNVEILKLNYNCNLYEKKNWNV